MGLNRNILKKLVALLALPPQAVSWLAARRERYRHPVSGNDATWSSYFFAPVQMLGGHGRTASLSCGSLFSTRRQLYFLSNWLYNVGWGARAGRLWAQKHHREFWLWSQMLVSWHTVRMQCHLLLTQHSNAQNWCRNKPMCHKKNTLNRNQKNRWADSGARHDFAVQRGHFSNNSPQLESETSTNQVAGCLLFKLATDLTFWRIIWRMFQSRWWKSTNETVTPLFPVKIITCFVWQTRQ